MKLFVSKVMANLNRARAKGNKKAKICDLDRQWRTIMNKASKLEAKMIRPYEIGSKVLTDYIVAGYLARRDAYADYTEACGIE